jgi:hypothetical protein
LNDAELLAVVEKAFDYRGDVTITTRDGKSIEGYVFDRRPGESVRLLPKNDGGQKLTVPYADIADLQFTGRDTAAGKSWEAWVKKYRERHAAGEKNIALEPESLE